MGLNPVRTKDEARERGRRGGIASGRTRRLKRDARAVLEMLLQGHCEVNGARLTRLEAICLCQVEKALEGDTRAFNAVLDRVEGRPMQAQRPMEAQEPLDIQIQWVSAKDGRKLEDCSPQELTDLGKIAFRGTPEEQAALLSEWHREQ